TWGTRLPGRQLLKLRFKPIDFHLSILSKIDIMKSVSATDAKQRLAAVLDAAQREPVVIRRQNRDVAVVMSAEEYERMRNLNAAEFQRFCDRVGAQATARGLTEARLKKLLKDKLLKN
ncbi:MAG: type II toxin-antitoxin system Phd/YefM family antitoxin, partial [Terriglobales bacterium]